MEIDEPAIDVVVGIARLHDVCIRSAKRCVRAVGGARGIADDEDLLPVVPAGDCPDAVEVCPAREPPVDIGAVPADEVVAWVDDRIRRAFFAAVREEVLDMGARTRAHVGEGEPFHAAPGCAESAEIVLLPIHVAAVGEAARLLERLRECDIGTYTFVLRLFVVGMDKLFGRAREFRGRIAAQKVGEHLLLGCRCLARDGDFGRLRRGHFEDVGICGGQGEMDFCGKCCIHRRSLWDCVGKCGA